MGLVKDCRLLLGDCVDEMLKIDEESIDQVIFSPPYNVGITYEGSEHNDSLLIGEYHDFARNVMFRLKRIVKNGGRVCVEIGGSGRNFPLSWIWQSAAYEYRFGLFSEIAIEHRKTNQTAWGSWMKADAVNTIPNFHLMYIFYKGSERKEGTETTITKDEFVEWTRGYWKMNYSGGERLHPAQFPLELPMRCMKLFGHKNDVVLDPFMGSGTTGVAAHVLERHFIGIEASPGYFSIARNRIEGERRKISLFDMEE